MLLKGCKLTVINDGDLTYSMVTVGNSTALYTWKLLKE